MLFGEPAGQAHVRTRSATSPRTTVSPNITPLQLLDFYGSLYGMNRDDRRRRIPEMLDQVGIKGRMHSKIRTFSKA